MRSNTKKILGAVAVAGIVAASGSAFTGTGISRGAEGQANDFVGGTVTQSVTGATLSSVGYNANPDVPAGTDIDSVSITFTAALTADQVVTATANKGSVATGANAPATLTCGTPATTVTCTVLEGTNINTLDITVASGNA